MDTRVLRLLQLVFVGMLGIAVLGCSLEQDQQPAPRPTATPAPTLVSEMASNPAPATPAVSPVATTTPAPAPRVRLGSIDAPSSWNFSQPALQAPAAVFVRQLISRAPASRTASWQLRPDLATWQWQDDELVISLNDDVTWSDGTPVTVDDLTATIEQARDAGTFAYQVEDVIPTGDGAIRLRFDTTPASCAAATEVLQWPLLSSSAWPPTITSGSYTVASESGSQWALQPAKSGLPTIDLEQLPDAPALEEAWNTDAVDLILGDDWLMGQPPPVDAAGRVQDVPGPLLAAMAFRLHHPILDDVDVRTALALATDRSALYGDSYGGATPALTALLPPAHWAAPEEGPATGDIAAARDMLERAGWRDRDNDGIREDADGEPLQLTLILPLSQTDARWEQLGPALQRQWADAGVDLELLYQEPVPFEERIHRPAWDVALLAFNVSSDPDQTALWSAPNDLLSEDLNVMGYANRTVQELMERAGRVAGCDPEQRAPLYHQAWDIINEELPMLVLFPLPTRIFVGPALQDTNLAYWPPTDVCSLLRCR